MYLQKQKNTFEPTDMEEWYADDYVLRGPVIGQRQMFRTEQFFTEFEK